ncbi:Bug family tripartite tricarboxylate transporter substrate binding protein [Paucibacter sp. XJ19-41]|uniref:Bug family tripartite tricarboxylate transporter substrate binding protein n=1 Tax=Paucibacter sp. XJ19-41 TaxID=2927824 RepID=UPI00234971BF|nr:tripartite tricarboxylate transporter substrate binding protein [Paucibacter sp. XJ19-41]MDC6167123.1 tripartite tricarboxylate transporter substrate binding protein [Paucibacter sp. XJ19-41]
MSLLNRRALVALAALLAVGGAHADGATDKPLRLILPVGAGSGVDTIIRAVTPALSKALGGQAVVIENLPGAGGITGTAALVKAVPDGLTLGVVSNNHVVSPSVYKKMPFDALNDITPIMVVGATPFVLVVNPSKLPATNVKELVALLKAKPDVYNYASSGNGTILHLGAEMFVDEAGVVMRHIPYKGVGPMVADLIGGQVDLGVLSLPSIQGHLKSGALRAIGIGSAARVPAAPEIATVAEQGLPNYAIEGWFAVVGPARLPPAQVKRFHAAFTAALAAPEVREAMARQGNVINPTTPEAAASFFRSEQERYAKLVKKAGISLD